MLYGIRENVLLMITGSIIFLPMCFILKPIHGIVMGVTMHYMQYLALTYKVSLKRKSEKKSPKKIDYSFLIIIFSYGILMALLSLSNKTDNELFKHLLLIPLLGQLLHFFLDGFLWKFSDPHHRNHTLKYIKS